MTTLSDPSASVRRKTALLFAAWAIALLASLAVLFIGEVLGQSPCVLCWFQRAFMFPLAVILGVAVWRSDHEIWKYGAPLAVIGGVVAAYHSLLYIGILPEEVEPCTAVGPSCTDREMVVLGTPVPILALLAFGAILALLLKLREGRDA